ncbi:MAG: ACP S-malonyltransferase [Phycisphaerales bacterium]|nr:ACP S-malonyltransferase [Phycisphaerales bacterium]MCB9862055.1 ACP S-malonyltransferase [Phycisphaerales bacterium]
MSKTAIIFPGQGSQVVGMGKDVADVSAAARKVYADANRILGWDLTTLCFEGPAERLNATDASQPAIFVTSVAIWEACKERGLVDEWAPTAMAGLSLGEYTALHLAGWFGFEAGLKLVAERGRLMQAAAESSRGGMVSIMGVDEAVVNTICAEAADGDVLAPANFNCAGQIVISGSKEACDRSVAVAEKYGARAIPLVVAGAFHSPLMQPAVDGLELALRDTEITSGTLGVVSNVSADYHADPNTVRGLLREQVAKPIRWQASIERLVAEGFDRFIEVGPGRVLTGLMRKIDRSAKALNFSAAAALEKVPA